VNAVTESLFSIDLLHAALSEAEDRPIATNLVFLFSCDFVMVWYDPTRYLCLCDAISNLHLLTKLLRSHEPRKMVKVILFLVAFVALAHVAKACDDKHQDIGTCKIKYHVCNHVNHGQMQYQCDAMDEADGENYKADWHSSPDKACEDSTYHLFKEIGCHSYNDYDCNCEVQEVDQSTCHLQVGVCFYFTEKDDVKKGKVHYKGYAFDRDDGCHDHEGKSSDQSDPEQAGQMAADDLFANYADTAKKCGQQADLRGAIDAAVGNVTSILNERMKTIFHS
jgi:hypothetical protein